MMTILETLQFACDKYPNNPNAVDICLLDFAEIKADNDSLLFLRKKGTPHARTQALRNILNSKSKDKKSFAIRAILNVHF
jgi:hypothetical protein